MKLVLANTWSLLGCLEVLTNCLGICIHLASWICSTTVSCPHRLTARLYCHNNCINVLALMVTGDSNPSGSKTLDDSLKTSLFVTSEVALGIGHER